MWIKKANEIEETVIEKPKGGEGVLTCKEIHFDTHPVHEHIVSFRKNVLPVGSGLGYHAHVQTSETIYVLEGECEYLDNDKVKHILHEGDAAYCGDGESHSIFAIGDKPLVIMAIIMKEA